MDPETRQWLAFFCGYLFGVVSIVLIDLIRIYLHRRS